MKNTGKAMKFAVAMFGILMASPTVWGQVHSDENGFVPFGTKGESEMLEFIFSRTRDAADTVTKLEAAAEEVEQNKPPHFGTLPSVAVDQYKQATKDIEKSLDLTFPSSVLTLNRPPTKVRPEARNPQKEVSLIQNLHDLLWKLRMKHEVGVEMRSQLDGEIAFADRKLKEALRAKEILERALNPAAESGKDAAKWWADMDDLATAIADYKSALERRRQREDATLSQLSLQIQNGEGWVALLEQDTWNQFWDQLKLNAAVQADRDRLLQQYEPTTGLFGLSIPAGGQTNAAEHDAEGKQAGPDHSSPIEHSETATDHAQRSEPAMLEAGHGSLAEAHGSKDGSGVEVHSKP